MWEDLIKKRRQVRAAWDNEKIPSKEEVNTLLKKCLELTPSKNNLQPFKIHVIGPDNKKELDIITGICALHKTGSVAKYELEMDTNTDLGLHYKRPPYTLLFTVRLANDNQFTAEHENRHKQTNIDVGRTDKRFSQSDPNTFRRTANRNLASLEVGMFIMSLTALALEKGLSVSFIQSWPIWDWDERENKYIVEKNKYGKQWSELPWVKEAPLHVLQLGYKADFDDPLKTNSTDPKGENWENKCSPDDIIEFHNA